MTNTSDALADHDLYAVGDLSAYKGIFASNTLIADAMGYSALPVSLREDIWQKFAEAEGNLGVLDIANPAAMPPNQHSITVTEDIALTQAEALDSYSSKVAHAFYLEANKVYPWSILGLDLESCKGLFDPAELFYSWDIDGPTYAELSKICDHSPKRVHDVAVTLLTSPRNPTAAIAQFILHGGDFAHSTTSTTVSGWSPDPHAQTIMTADQVMATGYKDVGNQYGVGNANFISRSGCHMMAQWQPALARSVNIPCRDIHAWYYPRAIESVEGRPSVVTTGHHSCWYPSLPKRHMRALPNYPDTGTARGLVLWHGDDTYAVDAIDGTDEGKALALLVNKSWVDTYIAGQSWQDRNKRSGAVLLQRYRTGAVDFTQSTWQTYGWAQAHSAGKHIYADQLDELIAFRRQLEGREGDVPLYEYTKMVWPVGEFARQDLNFAIGGALTLPAGTQDDDLIVFAHVNSDVAADTSAVLPAGFTHVSGSPMTSCGSTTLIVGYKIAASEGATITYGNVNPTSNRSSAMLVVLRNADTAQPIGVTGTACDVTTSGNISAPLLAPTDEDDFWQIIFAGKANDDLGLSFGSQDVGTTTLPNMGHTFDYNYTGAPAWEVSLIGAMGARGPNEKITPTALVAPGARDGVGVPVVSIQIRRTP